MVNKKGWIRIVEATVAILLITGATLLVLDKTHLKADPLEEIANLENFILKDIELNSTLRSEILNAEINGDIPEKVLTSIENSLTKEINCTAKICGHSDVCVLDDYEEKEVYADSALISANSSSYNPRQFKLFCWKLD